MTKAEDFTTIVRTQRRITLPGEFDVGDFVRVVVERVARGSGGKQE